MGKGKGYDKLPTFEDRSSDEENDFVRQHMNSKQMIQQQDQSLDMLGSSVLRLGEMSMNIHDELKDQNKMLDEMDGDLDKATSNLEIVTKKTQDLIKKSGGCMNFFVIVGLSVVVLVLFFLIIHTYYLGLGLRLGLGLELRLGLGLELGLFRKRVVIE